MKKNLFYIYGVNLINGLAGIAFIPLAMKSLEAEGYGIYSIFVILSSYVYFVEMGVAKYFTRTIAQTENNEELRANMQAAVGIYFRIAILLLILTPILFFIVPNFIFPTSSNFLVGIIVILVSLDYLLSIPTTILMTFNMGKEEFEKISKYNLLSGLSKHLFLISTVILTNSVLLLICIILIRRIFDIIYAKKILEPLPIGSWKPKYSKGEFKNILKESILLSGAQLTQVTILALGTFLMNKSFSIKEVGIYKSVFDLATKVWFFSNSLGMVVFPRFSAMLKDKKTKLFLLKKIPFYINLSWLAYNLLFVIVFFILPFLPNFLMIQDMKLFFFLLFGVCLNAHTNLSYEFLQAASKLKEVIITSFATIIFMVTIFYSCLNSFNFYSIGIAWGISQFINSFIMDSFVLKELNLLKMFYTLSLNLITSIFMMIILFAF